MEKKKIKLALMWFSYIGEGSSFNELVRRLDPERFDLIFISLKKRKGDPEGRDNNGHKVFYLTRDRRINAFSLSILWKLLKVLRSERVDILHAHRHKPCFYAAIARFFVSIPVVLGHVHGLNRTKNSRRKLLNRFMFNKLDKVLGCANKVCDDIRSSNPGLDPDKVVTLENSVDYQKFAGAVADRNVIRAELGMPENAFLFLAIGRFVPTKDFQSLIKAFAKVRQVHKCHLLFAGDGRQRAEMEDLVKSLGFEDCVHMPGRMPDIPQLMKACDCFVMSSIAEGMPLSLLEAMASGLPCVATRVGGIPEVINSDKVGKLVSSCDVDALAGGMAEMVEMPDQQRLEMIENTRQRVRTRFCHEKLAADLTDIYESQLKASVK